MRTDENPSIHADDVIQWATNLGRTLLRYLSPSSLLTAELIQSMTRTSDEIKAPRPRTLLVASAGGHWIELSRLSGTFRDCDCQFVSTAGDLRAPTGDRPVLQMADSSRDTLMTMIVSVIGLWRIVHGFKPQIVVSTGAAPGAVALVIAKLYGAQTIWIDSIANSDALSLSGRAVRFIADLRLTQWPDLTKKYRGLAYFGQVL
jgi:hypothetical protein